MFFIFAALILFVLCVVAISLARAANEEEIPVHPEIERLRERLREIEEGEE